MSRYFNYQTGYPVDPNGQPNAGERNDAEQMQHESVPHFQFHETCPAAPQQPVEGQDNQQNWYTPATYHQDIYDTPNNNVGWENPSVQQPSIPHYSLIPGFEHLNEQEHAELQRWWTFLPRNTQYEIDTFKKNPSKTLDESFNMSIEVDADNMPDVTKDIEDLEVEAFLKGNLVIDDHNNLSLMERYASTLFINNRNFIAYVPQNMDKNYSFLIPLINKVQQLGPYMLKDQETFETLPVSVIFCATESQVLEVYKLALKLTYRSNIFVTASLANNFECLQQLRQGCHILISTPPMVKELLSRHVINLKMLKTVIYADFDRILERGMESDLIFITSYPDVPNKHDIQVAMFARVLTSDMKRCMKIFIGRFDQFKITSKYSDYDNVGPITVYYVENDKKPYASVELLTDMEYFLHLTVILTREVSPMTLAEVLSVNQIDSCIIDAENMQDFRRKALDPKNKVLIMSFETFAKIKLPFEVNNLFLFELPSDFDSFCPLIQGLRSSVNYSVFITDTDRERAKDLFYFMKSLKRKYPDWMPGFCQVSQNDKERNVTERIIGTNAQINRTKNPHIKVNTISKVKNWLKKRRLARQK